MADTLPLPDPLIASLAHARDPARYRCSTAQSQAARPFDARHARWLDALPGRRRLGRRRADGPGRPATVRLAARLHHAPPLRSHDRPRPSADHPLDRRPEHAVRGLRPGRHPTADGQAARLPALGHRGAPRPHDRSRAAGRARDRDRGGQDPRSRRHADLRVPGRARSRQAGLRLPLRRRGAEPGDLRRHAALREPHEVEPRRGRPHPRVLRDGAAPRGRRAAAGRRSRTRSATWPRITRSRTRSGASPRAPGPSAW